jgi:hypothetical protein
MCEENNRGELLEQRQPKASKTCAYDADGQKLFETDGNGNQNWQWSRITISHMKHMSMGCSELVMKDLMGRRHTINMTPKDQWADKRVVKNLMHYCLKYGIMILYPKGTSSLCSGRATA